MLNTLRNMLRTPQGSNIVTVSTAPSSSQSNLPSDFHTGRPKSNSTTVDFEDGCVNPSSNSSNSSFNSPSKTTRNNSMSNSSSFNSDNNEHNVSLFLKHNINSVNLEDSETQKIALRYLLEKVRDIESLLIESVRENKVLKDEISGIYDQNDALAAENLTLKEVVSKQGRENHVLADDIV